MADINHSIETKKTIKRKPKRPLQIEPSDENVASPIKKVKEENENFIKTQNEFYIETDNTKSVLQEIKQENVVKTDSVEQDIANLKELKKAKRLEFEKQKKEKQIEIQAKKREQSFKALKYLLNKSEVYSKYLEERFEKSVPNSNKGGKKNQIKKSQAESNVDFDFKELKTASKTALPASVLKMPSLFENGVLRDYQLEGVEWLKILFENGVNGILADEMGLGKTVQIIAFICYLYSKNITGPFLISAPLSTLPNWDSEFKRFAPKIPVVLFHGKKEERQNLIKDILRQNYVVGNNSKCSPVVLTSFQIPIIEQRVFARRTWKYIIVDEGHRLKNHECQLYGVFNSFNSINRLLITGTPLQNNLRELWSLLHFLLPEIFTNYEIFESWLDLDELKDGAEKFIKQEEETQALSMMHNILKPFVLRRLKTDVALNIPPKKEVVVFCPLTPKQMDLYKFVLDKNYSALENKTDAYLENLPLKRKSKLRTQTFKELSSDEEFCDTDSVSSNDFTLPEQETLVRVTMQNSAMMFRKIVNHPYLIHFPLKTPISSNNKIVELRVDEELVTQSGKMMMLDALASRLIARGHKILVFCTLTMMLDIIEEFVIMRGYEYCRLDGSLNIEERQEAMHSFNTSDKIKIFLISTRAGGLGLNLIGADTVILYDSDWNPQVDLQAQDRCHRIGQTKPVVVYQFVTRGTIDEAIIAEGDKKRKLEKLIIQTDKFKLKSHKLKLKDKTDLDILKKLLTEEEKNIVTSEDVFSDKELNKLLDRSDLLEKMKN